MEKELETGPETLEPKDSEATDHSASNKDANTDSDLADLAELKREFRKRGLS